jgi:hypothetical protein
MKSIDVTISYSLALVGRASVVRLHGVTVGIGMREHRCKGEDGASNASAWCGLVSRTAPTVPVAIRIAAAVLG